MKSLYESLLDVMDIEDTSSAMVQGLYDPKNRQLYIQAYKLLKDEVINTQKKPIKLDPEKIDYNKVFEKDKIYVMFESVDDITLCRLSREKKSVCLFGTSRSGWFSCYRHFGVWKKVYHAKDELYELPKQYYDLWGILHNSINPKNKDFDL